MTAAIVVLLAVMATCTVLLIVGLYIFSAYLQRRLDAMHYTLAEVYEAIADYDENDSGAEDGDIWGDEEQESSQWN